MLTPLRAVTVTKAAILITALVAAASFGAERIGKRSTPRGKTAPAGFKIYGTVRTPLVPGRTLPLNLLLVNKHTWPIRIRRISVSMTVDRAHDRAGCARLVHYRQRAMPRSSYPIVMRPRTRLTLRQLGVRRLPSITMLNLAKNQDVCRGAKLRLRYRGVSQRAGRSRAR